LLGVLVVVAAEAAAQPPPAPSGGGQPREKAATAVALAAKGDSAGALRIWKELAASDARAVDSAARAVKVISDLKGAETPLAYCQSFVDQGRGAQAVACGSAAPALQRGYTRGIQQFWVDAVAALPSPTADDANALVATQGLGVELDSLTGCQKGFRPMAKAHWPEALDPSPAFSEVSTEELYLRLSESVEGPTGHCLLAVAASRCMLKLMNRRDCRAPRSVARFAESLARVDPARVPAFLEMLFQGKSALYSLLGKPTARPGAELSLLHVHVALAYVYSRLEGRYSTPKLPRRVQVPAFHVERAKYFWSQLHPGQPFPETLLDGIDDRSRLKFLPF
jgi:hypothetical protein